MAPNGRCAQCGKPSVGASIRGTPPRRTEWCETHFPDVWQMVRPQTQAAHKRWVRDYDRGRAQMRGW